MPESPLVVLDQRLVQAAEAVGRTPPLEPEPDACERALQ